MSEIQNANSVYDYTKPTQSHDEELTSVRLLANANADANRRPPIPNIGRVPSRYGYPVQPATIEDILNVDDTYPAKFGDWSGSVSGYGGTAYPSIPQM